MTERQKEVLEAVIFWIFIVAAEVGWIVFLFCFYDDLFVDP